MARNRTDEERARCAARFADGMFNCAVPFTDEAVKLIMRTGAIPPGGREGHELSWLIVALAHYHGQKLEGEA